MGYKNKPNNDYFKNINSSEKAYYLGLIYADGSIVQPKGNRQKTLTIALQEEDGYILERFAKNAGNKEISILYPPSVSKRNWKKRAVITIASNEICNDLINLGCLMNKSKIGMKFPLIDKKYYKDFIRGFMDGDGCITIKKIRYNYIRKTSNKRKDTHIQRHKLKIGFTSTDKEFLNKISNILNIENPYFAYKLRKMIVNTLWIEKEKEVKKVLEFIYKDSEIFLLRKYNKVIEFNKIIKSQAEDISSEGLETT